MSEPLYQKIISENEEKGTQLRLVLSEFRDVEYLHLRKYFLSFDGEYVPSKEGASMPATLQSVYSLLDGLIEVCSMHEDIEAITKHFADRIKELNDKQNS